MGCMAQLQQGRIQERAPYVDLVFGSPAIARVERAGGARPARSAPGPRHRRGRRSSRSPREPDAASRLKAFVTVMEGCEKHCTFCVVPVDARAASAAIRRTSIVEEIRGLAAAGCREVTLLGQTVNAYGRDLDPPTDLADRSSSGSSESRASRASASRPRTRTT